MLNDNNYHLKKGNFSYTATTNSSGHLFYSHSQTLMSRVDGPYSDLDVPMLRQLKNIKESHSYQQETIKLQKSV